MSTDIRASVMREHSVGLVESNSFFDSELNFLIPRTVCSMGVDSGVGKGRSARTVWDQEGGDYLEYLNL